MLFADRPRKTLLTNSSLRCRAILLQIHPYKPWRQWSIRLEAVLIFYLDVDTIGGSLPDVDTIGGSGFVCSRFHLIHGWIYICCRRRNFIQSWNERISYHKSTTSQRNDADTPGSACKTNNCPKHPISEDILIPPLSTWVFSKLSWVLTEFSIASITLTVANNHLGVLTDRLISIMMYS